MISYLFGFELLRTVLTNWHVAGAWQHILLCMKFSPCIQSLHGHTACVTQASSLCGPLCLWHALSLCVCYGVRAACRQDIFTKENDAACRCEVSGGVGTEWPVECHELWRFDEGSQTLQLRGFTALHPEIHVAKHLERQQEDKRRQQAIWMLQAMNE